MRVVNASPLIHLARVSLLDLLRMPGLDVPVVVPFIVFQKFLRGAKHDSSVGLVEQAARRLLLSGRLLLSVLFSKIIVVSSFFGEKRHQ